MAKDNNNNPVSLDEDYLDQLLNSVIDQEEEDYFGDLEYQLNSVSQSDTIDELSDLTEELNMGDYEEMSLEDLLSDTSSQDMDDIFGDLSSGEGMDDTLEDLSVESSAEESDAGEIPGKQNIEGLDEASSQEDMEMLGNLFFGEEESPQEEGLDNLLDSISGLQSEMGDLEGVLSREIGEDSPKKEEEKKPEVKESAKSKEDSEADSPKEQKKQGFFAKLFKKDAKEETNGGGAIDENEKIIKEMEGIDFSDPELLGLEDRSKKGAKGKKSKKEKGKGKEKEKEQKPKKEKKPKKKKEPKEKKEKPPVSPEDIIHIPIPVYGLILTLAVGISILLLFGGSTYSYHSKMDSAMEAFVNKDYQSAYNKLAGVSVKKGDEAFYNQVVTIMYVEKQYLSYETYRENGDYYRALNALLKGIERYDQHREEAVDLSVSEDMDLVFAKIIKQLKYDFDLSEKKARELLALSDSEAYSTKLVSVVNTCLFRIEENIEKESQKTEQKTAGGDETE